MKLRKILEVILVISCCLTLIMINQFTKRFHRLKYLETRNETRKMKAVILLTQTRSGSSFVGQIFNQNPGVSYFYEPLYPFGKCSKKVGRYFDRILNYDVIGVSELYREAAMTSEVQGVEVQSCIDHGLCFYNCLEQKCSKFMSRDLNFCGNHGCKGGFNLTKLGEELRKQKLMAFKVTRVCDFRDIEKLIKDHRFETKLIHLVRDPRASMNSFQHVTSSKLKARTKHEERCEQLESLLNYSYSNSNLLNSSNYRLVKYEDIATRPIPITEEIYKFIGVKLHQNVRDWLNEATSSDQLLPDNFGTKQNAAKSISKWRYQMNFEDVTKIQSFCYTSMSRLGYNKFHNKEDLLNFNLPSYQ